MELLDTILDDHHTKKSEIDQSLINSMDTIAKYRLGPDKLEKIQAENKEKIERLQSKYLKQPHKRWRKVANKSSGLYRHRIFK